MYFLQSFQSKPRMHQHQEEQPLHNPSSAPPGSQVGYQQSMSGPYGQPGYNPQFNNPGYGAPYGANAPPPAGWTGQQQQQQFVPPPMPMHASYPGYAEEGQANDKYSMQFNDATIRAAFVRKVFMLVTIMLGVVAVMTAVPFFNKDTQLFVRRNLPLYICSYVTFFVVYLVLMCCESVRRSFPINLIMTGIFTLAVGYMTMMITSHHSIESVLLALIICTVCCAGVVIFATTTKRDLTNMMGVMFILSMCLLVFGIVAVISVAVFHVRFLYTIYALLGSILFMFYLAIDVQMLMGGRKYEISPEDHIFAAIQIFLDIVQIFWLLLSLFGSSNN